MATTRKRKIDLDRVRSRLYSITLGDDDRLAVAAARVLLQDSQAAQHVSAPSESLLEDISNALAVDRHLQGVGDRAA